MKSFPLLVSVMLVFMITNAQSKKVPEGKKISPDLFGLFFEDINYSADGGLYAELIQNRSFEYNPTEQKNWHPLSFWEYITPGYSYGRISVETSSPLNTNNPHYVVLHAEHVGHEANYTGESGVGIRNSGFDGIVVKAGDRYNFSVFAKQLSAQNVPMVKISLQNRKGETLAENKITIDSKDWKKYECALTSTQNYDTASLVLLITSPGTLALDMPSLFPARTFANRANGLRADMAQALADMKPKFIRFPGGCLVHGDGLENMYRWKNSIGPVEERKEQRNIWGYHQTLGLGYYEYFQFCEDIGAKPLPVLPAGVSCQNSGGTWRVGGTGQKALPLEEMQDYIQEVLDLVEWANGPVTSTWGARRAAAGHPASFHLQYIGIGNEDKITPEFEQRFKMIYDAVKRKHPEITVVGTAGPFHSGEDFDKGWDLVKRLQVPVVDEHYYTNPPWFISNQYRYDQYPRNGSQVYLGEYASWGNKMGNAIAEAVYLTSLERNGDVVRMASYAPLFAKKNFTQWKTDMIFFDNSKLYPTPNYHVQKLFSANSGDIYYDHIVSLNPADSLLAASCVRDSKSGDVILKFVNAGKEAKRVTADLSIFKNLFPNAAVTVLEGEAEAENNFAHPDRIAPATSSINVTKTFHHTLPAMSLTVVRIKTKPGQASNPVIFADVPDMAMIRVGNNYYMSSTTMHMSPGVPIMKSKDLVNWKLVGYAYDTLAGTDDLNLNNGRSTYGKGSWASSLRYHKGMFYVSTFAQTTGRTHIYSTRDIEKGPWTAISFRPSYHDHSLFFDDDGRVYLVYGAGRIRLVELEKDLSGRKLGSVEQVIIENASAPAGNNINLQAEGSQLFKVKGKYYLFNIVWPRNGMRTGVIHRANKITGPYEGRVALQDLGVAQGGLIDKPDGQWFAYLFRDYGAVGRIPYLVPVAWVDDWPVLGVDGKVPETLNLPAQQSLISNVVASDEFDRKKNDPSLPLVWQWNHNPDNSLWSVQERKGFLRLRTGRTDTSLMLARNMLTQRTIGPECSATTSIDVSMMKDGDVAGLVLLQQRYAYVAIRQSNSSKSIVLVSAETGMAVEMERVPLHQDLVYFKAECNFENRKDLANFYYSLDGKSWKGMNTPLKMAYTIPHFMGYRFGLFNYARKNTGGVADFDFFRISDRIVHGKE